MSRKYAAVADPRDLAVEHLLDYLVNWLAFHILGEDQNMVRQILAIRGGASAEKAFQAHEQECDSSEEPLLRTLHHNVRSGVCT